MTVLKCKMCGGNIQVTGETHGICDSCGCEVTLPKIDDDKRAAFYERGNYFRQKGEFDKAYASFEHIIADDLNDAEIYWCLVLCKYGIKYELDPRSGEYKPTLSRMSYQSIYDDSDYLKAMENSDEYTKSIYRREAGKIARIQERYIEISRKEDPYEVFICFKAEEDNGQRTKGSVIAQDIYEHLTDKGIKVFFSRITLLEHPGEDYEPYIFAALNSARIMLVVSNNPEHLQSVWVKNEWTRFLSMMDKDSGKSLVPVFVDMSPYDFPPEFMTSTTQGIDASRLGYQQDLMRGVLKLLGKNPDASVQTGTVGAVQLTIENLLKRSQQEIEDRNFEQALSFVEQVLNMEPENGEAYYYRFLAENKILRLQELVEVFSEWEKSATYKRIVQYCSQERKQEFEELRKRRGIHRTYLLGKKHMEGGNYEDAKGRLSAVEDYKDSKALIEKCDKLLHHEQMLKEYQETVRDGKTYLKERYEREQPEQYSEFKKLYDEYLGKSSNRSEWLTGLIIGVVMLFIGYMSFCKMNELLPLSENGPGWFVELFWPALWSFVVVGFVLIVIGFSGLLWIIGSAGLLVGMVALNAKVEWTIWIYPLVGVFALGIQINALLKSVGLTGAKDRYAEYESQYIIPYENAVMEELRERYGKVLAPEEMVELRGIKDGIYGVKEEN